MTITTTPSQRPSKRRVFLTGAAGNWGHKVLDEFRGRADRFDVVALVLSSPKDLAVIRRYEDMENLEVVFGDLTDYEAVERCVRGADIVLHIGAVVSPFADEHPELAHQVNTGSIRNIVRAVKAQPDPSRIAVVGVGTVAETGDRNPPHHWGRVGDPLRVSQYDEYGQSKVIAEKELVDSGLPRWVWLRQTGIFHPGMLEIRDPIMTHSTLGGVMEWVSVEDAARLMANVSEADVSEELWGGIYNIGGGEEWRLTNWQLQTRMTGALGVKDVRTWYDRNWFATRNFHGHWYTDSDRLQELVPFREDTVDAALARAIAANPGLRAAGKIPSWIVKNLVMKPLTRKPRGTMGYLRDGNTEAINAYFGSRAEWNAIGTWESFWPPRPDRAPSQLDHGYDESVPVDEWDAALLQGVAEFRGGSLLSERPTVGDVATPLEWVCAVGHGFTGSPRLILTAGHWCPECIRDVAGYAAQSEKNAFLAQIELAGSSAPRSAEPAEAVPAGRGR
ncbi:NAD-dependent epimerase/dehydratase family protein [Pseudoclavibacter terrae]|uniref:NAD(P)-dependent oxidoreductase n=1 Tax=Pseudoclavibacter terrae TaxID=1530195 RepID=A0A7J5AXF0_9MICO|nr:NAD(P)-dependent oxidoreductase [Pseudoclavibacter terrae]KAB1636089.1 NAD(P)-dependent oxidoreductase [Pseudoclavibacter terrae]